MDQNVHRSSICCFSKLLLCCSFILIFFGKAPSPLVECIVIDETDAEKGEELVKDFGSLHIENTSPEM